MFQLRRVVVSSSKTISNIRLSSSSTIPKLGTTPNKFNAKSSAFNLRPDLPDGLFYHPAPAAPNPEITPKAFLPKSDIRANSELYYPEQDRLITENIKYMPIISKSNIPKNYNFDSKIVEQIQSMRDENKSRKQIREALNVSDNFISLVSKPNPKTQEKQSKLLNKASRKWSAKTLKARKLKETRKLLWERDL